MNGISSNGRPCLAGAAAAEFGRFSQQALAAASQSVDRISREAASHGVLGAGSAATNQASAAATAAGATALAAALSTPEGQAAARDLLATAANFLSGLFRGAGAEVARGVALPPIV
jgi:hypothetical protein